MTAAGARHCQNSRTVRAYAPQFDEERREKPISETLISIPFQWIKQLGG
jgi:hypothetical protein